MHAYVAEHHVAAKNTRVKSPQALAGGVKGAENAARLLTHGRRLTPDEIGLYLVLDRKPRATLLALTNALRRRGLPIEILVAKSNGVTVCRRL